VDCYCCIGSGATAPPTSPWIQPVQSWVVSAKLYLCAYHVTSVKWTQSPVSCGQKHKSSILYISLHPVAMRSDTLFPLLRTGSREKSNLKTPCLNFVTHPPTYSGLTLRIKQLKAALFSCSALNRVGKERCTMTSSQHAWITRATLHDIARHCAPPPPLWWAVSQLSVFLIISISSSACVDLNATVNYTKCQIQNERKKKSVCLPRRKGM
jgi:hypothetical protein